MYPRQDRKSGLYGFWHRQGWAVRPQFGYAQRFISGHAVVDLTGAGFGLLRTDGTLFPLRELCGGRTPVEGDDSPFTGFVDLASEPSMYAAVLTGRRSRRSWGLIDMNLAYMALPDAVFSVADDVRPYGKYVVLIRKGRRIGEATCGLFNLDDMQLELPVKYSCLYPSRESIWVVRDAGPDPETPPCAFYDVSQHEFLPGRFWEAIPFSCGFGVIREQDGSSYFVDRALRRAFDTEFDDVCGFSHGLAAVYKDDDAGYIDITGAMRLFLPYEALGPFNEFGLAIANRNELEWDIDIIDRSGKAHANRLKTAQFWEGDFPYFKVSRSRSGSDHLLDAMCQLIF